MLHEISRPHRLARSRTPAFHAGNTGSNPVGDATLQRSKTRYGEKYDHLVFNFYLSWAFTEAAQMARRYNQRFRRYYDRKATQTNTIAAARALSNKLARICYYIMRDQVTFNQELILHSFGIAMLIQDLGWPKPF